MVKHKIKAVRRGMHGEIEMFQLDNDMVLTYEQCAEAIRQNLLPGYNVGKDRNGDDAIKSNRDANSGDENNLSMMPEF